MSRYYTINEVAKLLRLTPQAVQWRCRNGKLRAFKDGGRWLVSDETVFQLITGDEKD